MGWFTSKKEIAELRKQLLQLQQHIAHLNQPAGPDISSVLGVLLDGQVKQVDSFGGFIRMISDVAAERMGSALGRRGGKKRAATAARDSRGRMLPGSGRRATPSDCRLCDDPSLADFTAAEFDEHQKHRGRPRRVEAERIEPTAEEREVIEREPITVETHTHYPLPSVQHPMVPTPERNQDSGASGDSEGAHDGSAGNRNGVA